ncbi:MAG: HEAT repeat domain-containing protein [Treponema sp.]|nr:HEAT repeat domain-containing protein [Treponema sp.]
MKLTKKLFAVAAILCLAGVTFAQSQTVQKQSGSSNKETYVENEYLNDIDTEIIMGLAEADDLDSKLIALKYIEEAINEGNTSAGVIQALDQLSGEGVLSESRTNNRKMNNFPEVRREACLLMAQVPTEHTKNQLINIMVAEDEPMVLAAAVQSLGNIAPEDADEVIEAIAYVNKRNMVLNPTSSLAFEVIDAFEKLAPIATNRKQMINTLTQIYSNYRYNSTVRNKAQKLLKTLSNGGSSSSSNSKNADAK